MVSTLGEAASGLKIINKPKYTETIDYLAQYNESHFAFLKRIAKTYNEWLYFDGANLVFGEPSSMPTIPVVFGKHSDSIKIGISIRNVKYDRVSYHSQREEFMDGSTKDSVSGLDDLGNHAFGVSKKTFNFKGRSHTGPRIPDKYSLDEDLKKTQAASAADLSVVEGRSKKRGIRPGSIIKLTTEGKKDGGFPSRTYGNYLVISTKHVSTSACNYTNVFKAIPAGVKTLPTPEVRMPKAYSEIARVLSNEDPKGQGRVQVQTQWQKVAEGLSTDWVRVMTPDAGKSDLHPKNRGFVFIPEAGDEVMLGYRYGDPSRPFVAGSMYHGMNGAGGDKDNVIRSIITRSGHELVFDDTDGKEMIIITDKNQNSIVIDTKGDSIYVSANETIEMKAKNINLIASENITMLADKNIEGGAGKDASLTAVDSVLIDGGKDINLQAGRTLKGAGGKDIKFSSGSGSNLDLEANGKAKLETSKSIDLKTKDATIATKKQTNITANKVFMEGSMKTIIKGSKVDIS